ncbi:acyl-CoA dehydrogenase family protein [Brenneria corticis]|uniref:Acyl-CoA dehydrogenase n=1 Tax=Brenneria corticis TaxID=2173106 RepID=A0A2U1TVD5_9GAMM|nr:acyl-CoA dehydrogenase family protein [Brenneria sp. CFCC 11842]PWC13354.1 acyl-CoA dehydrogenase [Brenneria sp. CFCC 11842]
MLNDTLRRWLSAEANDLDQSAAQSAVLPSRLGDAGLFRIGVPDELGGSGGAIIDAIEAVSEVARCSLTAAFVFWGHRTYIELLLQSPQSALRESQLPDLLAGKTAGATGLSNAMKFLSGLEELQVTGREDEKGWTVDGRLHWVTNLQRAGFQVMTVVRPLDDRPPFIAAIASDLDGVRRSEDLNLMSMRGSATAALDFAQVRLDRSAIVHSDAETFLPQVRPRFLGLQCGMALGLTRQVLENCRERLSRGHLLYEEWRQLQRSYDDIQTQLLRGVSQERFTQRPAEMFRLRIALIELALQGIQLELVLRGGKAYLSPEGDHFARRWRESAFLPLITPSIMQLRHQLAETAR